MERRSFGSRPHLIAQSFTVKRLWTFNEPPASKRSQGMRSLKSNPAKLTRIPLAAIGVGLGLTVAVYTTGNAHEGPILADYGRRISAKSVAIDP